VVLWGTETIAETPPVRAASVHSVIIVEVRYQEAADVQLRVQHITVIDIASIDVARVSRRAVDCTMRMKCCSIARVVLIVAASRRYPVSFGIFAALLRLVSTGRSSESDYRSKIHGRHRTRENGIGM
jgi:hypothetical protein